MDVTRVRRSRAATSFPHPGSFIRSCLKPLVSKMSMDMEIVYYEQESGVLQKVAELLVQTRNGVSLDQICREALQKRHSGNGRTIGALPADMQLKCYSSLFQGEDGDSVEIDLSKQPNEVDCILEALQNDSRPVLYLLREPPQDDDNGGREGSPFTRKGSGMVKEFISRTPRHSRVTPPISEDATSPVHSAGISMEQVKQNGMETNHADFKHANLHGHRTVPQSPEKVSPDNRLLERVASELYHCQDSLLPVAISEVRHPSTSTEEGEEEDEDVMVENRASCGVRPAPSSAPSHHRTPLHSQDSYEELLTILETPSDSEQIISPPAHFRPKLDTVAHHSESVPNKPKSHGFLTIQRRMKNPLLSRDQHFNDFSRMSESYGYEGPPSPQLQDRFSLLPPAEERERGPPGVKGERERRRREAVSRKFKRKTAIRRQRRKVGGSISELPPDTSYGYRIDYVQVCADGQTIHNIHCREYHTIGELKEAVVKTLNRHRGEEQREIGTWKCSDVVLVYSLHEQEYELYNEYQFIYSTGLYKCWSQEGSTITPANTIVTVRSAGRTGDRDRETTLRLSHLTGLVLEDCTPCMKGSETGCLWRIADGDKREVQWARRLLHSYVMKEVAARDEEKYCLSMELVSRQTSTILALRIPLDNKVEITFHYQQSFSLTKRVNVHRTAVSVLEELYQCVVACGLIEEEKSQSSEYVLQVSGERSYIAGENELLSFKDIRHCIIKSEPIHLSISPRPDPANDVPFKIHMVPIDAHSELPPLHTDIAALSHKECDSQALSIWDVKDELSLQVVQLDHLPVRSLPNKTPVMVEASLYHGATQLCDTCYTTPKTINGLLRIKEAMTFKIAKKDVPKSAKIMFIVREPCPRKESTAGTRRTSGGRFLYWGLVSITDHQNMLRMGEVQVALWKGPCKDSGEDSFEPNPCTPAYNNPDPKAVLLTIKLDSYCFPVYYPSTTPQSWTSLLGMNEGNTALRKQFLRLLDLIKEGKLHSALPTYIEKLEWGNLSKTLEVYSLLTQLMEAKHFPVETAIKMLDGNFPDEHVRRFAVNALHELADDELEDLLLQLTQALKFEPHHDSPLARLLLKRALRNKRIGHFLFWYLKCELHNPLYALRCGIILEAYLKGCGEAMMRQFEDQVDIQMKLEEIAMELKQRCSDDHSKMQSLLPELLETHGVPTFTLTPVYNPRIRLGNLRPNKCKVMSSKKKPQWLEMYNVDPTVLRQSPTRLILKLGDDLRQDMITLRMFSLFEKLWEEDGLSDLCLIPYGCMATGPKTGFIEVVNNARTIAEVSGVSNQTKLLEWIKSHQINEFGELDPEKLKTAVKKFTHSCAGYSVATYVLGIGDRHNDNIMVTTSGNLFHIDFGHFLGNIKYYMGFKREWAPFVLTPDLVYVMGGEEGAMFETYKNLCCRAFLTLRRNADLIINLFSLMRSTGIPELTCVEDTDYIRNALVLDKMEQEAEQLFRKVIKKCLDLKWTVQMMWKIHLIRKKGTP